MCSALLLLVCSRPSGPNPPGAPQFTFFGQFLVFITPNQLLAQLLAAFMNQLWTIFAGFLVPYPSMPTASGGSWAPGCLWQPGSSPSWLRLVWGITDARLIWHVGV